jgi:hypothetical protein
MSEDDNMSHQERVEQVRQARENPFQDAFDPSVPGSNTGDLPEPITNRRILEQGTMSKSDNADASACDCDPPRYVVEAAELGPYFVQVVYCAACETLLLSDISEGAE